MKTGKIIYIASSWRNQHGVELLTCQLREQGHEVISWIENNYGEGYSVHSDMPFTEWVKSESGQRAFDFDTNGAMSCDLLIYYGSAGKDAAAECGMAFAKKVPMIALWSKGEDFGLMRKMFSQWFERWGDLLQFTDPKIATDRF